MRATAAKLVRMLVAGAVCGIVGVVLIYGSWRLLTPYVEEYRTRREVAQLDRRVGELRAEHSRLQEQAELLATPEGIKQEARRLGLLKPGERSLRFLTRPEPRAMPPEPESVPSGILERLRAWGRAPILSGRPDGAGGPATEAEPQPAE